MCVLGWTGNLSRVYALETPLSSQTGQMMDGCLFKFPFYVHFYMFSLLYSSILIILDASGNGNIMKINRFYCAGSCSGNPVVFRGFTSESATFNAIIITLHNYTGQVQISSADLKQLLLTSNLRNKQHPRCTVQQVALTKLTKSD